jgi:formiminoglutamase
MLQNWLSPIKSKAVLNAATAAHQIGNHISIFKGRLPKLQEGQLAIIGLDTPTANAIRTELYQLDYDFGVDIIDLGNVRKKEIEFLIPLLRELLDSQVFPIIIGDHPNLSIAQYKAFLMLKKAISLVTVDQRVPFHESEEETEYYLNEIINSDRSQLFHLGLVGVQSHYGPKSSFNFCEEHNFDIARLGKLRAQITEVEPIIRDADLLSFNINSIRAADAPGQNKPSPGGLFHEEACQIARYAGMSDKLRSFGVFGYAKKKDQEQQTAQSIAQMIWYFINGFNNRKGDYPVTTEGLVEYIVDIKKLNYQLTFWKSKRSGRWWMQIPVKTKESYQRHRLISCSHQDYKMACQEELPDRLVNALKRFI